MTYKHETGYYLTSDSEPALCNDSDNLSLTLMLVGSCAQTTTVKPEWHARVKAVLILPQVILLRLCV